MAESTLFILLVGIVVIGLFQLFNIHWVDPRLIVGILALLLIPGFYAAFKSGPFVPSSKKRHQSMLNLAKVNAKDIVYDLGCGDGRLVFSAAKKAKKAIGYELSIPLVLYGKFLSLFKPRAKICFGNIWQQDYSNANVIFCYLLPKAMSQFYKEVWPNLKPGTRVVSNAFAIHDLEPNEKDETEKVFVYVK